MKRSTTLILLAALVIVGCLIFYNFKLKEVYDTKEYKNRFSEMEFTAIQGINALDLKSANHIGIHVEYGTEEGLWVSKRFKDNFKFSANGSTLNLDVIKKERSEGYIISGYFLILITKDLNRIIATHANDRASGFGQVRLKGFKLSKMDIQVAADTQFYFDDVQLDTLNAKIGGDEYAGKAELILPFNCTVNEASFNIGINGSVNLQGAKVLNTQSSSTNEMKK